jgi:hypothetical protein
MTPDEERFIELGAKIGMIHLIAPVADLLEDQQSQHHVSRRAPTAAAAAAQADTGSHSIFDGAGYPSIAAG